MMREELVERVAAAGVVGAGGAGFPTHVKVNASVETVIVNGAECEPLLYKDKELLRLESDRLLEAVRLVKEAMGASRGVVAFKEKKANLEAVRIYREKTKEYSGIECFLLGDYYPAGDEVLLVYDVTGKVPPFGGLPLDVGAMNSNVETFLWIGDAYEGKPVTEKWLTMAGEVRKPVTIKVPVGTPFKDCLAAAGGATCTDFGILSGGIMMATVVGLDDVVTKTTGGYVLLPKDHFAYQRKTQERPIYDKIGKSCCDQCMYCTEFCPRYLVGHPIEPHRVMRSLGLSGPGKDIETQWAQACIHCGVCGLFACPELLSPHEISWDARAHLAEKGFRPEKTPAKAHPMYEFRKIPLKRLTARLALQEYDVPAHFEPIEVKPERVILKMKQHAGAAAVPVVGAGDSVTVGTVVGRIPEGALGANVHASIDGIVESADERAVIIRRN